MRFGKITLALLTSLAACKSRQPPLPPGGTPPHADLVGHHEIRAEDLPPPNATADAENGPKVVPAPPDAKLVLPPGFAIDKFAEGGFQKPRLLALTPSGEVLVADADAGQIILLRDADHDGKSESRSTFATGLNKPFGMAFHGNAFFVGNTDGIVRFDYERGASAVTGPPVPITDLPGRGYREHWTRNVVVRPDGQKLYVTIGSQSNVDGDEDRRRASIEEMDLDGKNRRTFVSGTRNPIGLDFHPTTKSLWAAVQERDRLGDDLVPDYVTEARDGAFYGWPFSYVGKHPDPRRKGEHPELVERAIPGDVLVQAHSAVMDLKFYGGSMFPAEYQGDAFVSFHGSWNRSKRTGYKIVRLRFHDGKPVGGYDDFLTGWMLGEDDARVWGRPVGLLVLPDGSMLVCDDGANVVWRITYRGNSP